MRLDSARELKASLLNKYVKPLVKPAFATALGVAARSVSWLEAVPRTMALGIARKGRKDFRLAVRVQNRALWGSDYLAAIRKAARGEVDIKYVGRVVKRAPWHQSRQRPLLIGCSIGHFRITAGTLGCLVRRGSTSLILSNNHVLADENAGKKGDAIIQPGSFDGGTRGKDTVGTLERFVRLLPGRVNRVDAAVARIKPGVLFDPRRLRGLGTLQGVGQPPDVGDRVAKVGRTTGVTRGRVTAIELDNVVVGYDMGNLRFDDQIEIEGAGTRSFSQGGDSGSLIVDADLKGVALLFAGGDVGGTNGLGLTYANALPLVLSALSITW